jgi:hypothetical protein
LIAGRPPGEEALLYYSGHGIKIKGTAYLCAFDTNLAEIDLSGLRMEDIGRFAGNSHAAQVLAVLDCCYSGAGAEKLFGEGLLGDTTQDTSIHLLTAATASQVAKESKIKKMSVFSYYFCEGIQTGGATNSSGEVTASSIHSYIVKRITGAEKNVQPPRYNVKNKRSEFYIRTPMQNLSVKFSMISELLELNTQNIIGMEEGTLILKNCFGSADFPRLWNDKMVQAVQDFRTKQINLDEFRRVHKLVAKKKMSRATRVFWIAAIIFVVFLVIWALNS